MRSCADAIGPTCRSWESGHDDDSPAFPGCPGATQGPVTARGPPKANDPSHILGQVSQLGGGQHLQGRAWPPPEQLSQVVVSGTVGHSWTLRGTETVALEKALGGLGCLGRHLHPGFGGGSLRTNSPAWIPWSGSRARHRLLFPRAGSAPWWWQ